jgi:pimeloyl-ACP methyl ester carboxylesterase
VAQGCTEELVAIRSEDGYSLEGAVIRPAVPPPAGKKARPVLWVHGLTGRFCTPQIVAIGRTIARRGHTFVTGNNRGHDFGAVLRNAKQERLVAGGAWENFEESVFDVAAWVAFAAGGGGEIVLLGHSLGSLKVAWYLGRRPDPRVRALIAASPPLRAGQWKDGTHELAAAMVRDGRGRDLLRWDLIDAGAGTLSAQTVLGWERAGIDVYGEHTADSAVSKVTCPILAFYGTDEGWVGSEPDLQIIKRSARRSPRVDTAIVQGADHNYNGCEDKVGDLIADWVESLRD